MLLDAVSLVSPYSSFQLLKPEYDSAFAASLDGALSPMVGPGYVLLAKQFNVSVDNITSSFGFILLGLGIFMYVGDQLLQRPTILCLALY